MSIQSQLSSVINAIGSDIKYLTNRDVEASKVKGNLLVDTISTTSISATTFYGDGSNLTGISSNSGKIGISNSIGKYNYYNSLQEAIDIANSGDTIELFSSIVETGNVSINLKNGVNINGNGNTYTLNNSGTTNAFIDGGTTTRKDVYIFNLIIKRIGGTNNLYNSLSMYINGNSTIFCNNVWLINSFGTGLYVYGDNSKPAKVIGVKINSEVNGANIGGTSGISGELKSSHVISNTGIGINVGLGRLFDCIGESTSGYGIYNGGEIYNCKGISNTNYGINSTYNGGTSTPKSYDSTAISYSAVSMYLDGEIYACTSICEWNDSNGHAIRIVSNNSIISNCNLIVKNQNANCIYSSSSINVKYNKNTFKGSTRSVHLNITQGITNTSDNQGNILI